MGPNGVRCQDWPCWLVVGSKLPLLLLWALQINHERREQQYPFKCSLYIFCLVFLVCWGVVRLSPLGTSATVWPIVPAPDDRWWMWSSRWNENWQGKPKYSEKTCPSVTLSTTNPILPDLGSNTGRRGGKPATNRLSCGAANASSNQKFKNFLPTSLWKVSHVGRSHWQIIRTG
jgi:hypothetical protein